MGGKENSGSRANAGNAPITGNTASRTVSAKIGLSGLALGSLSLSVAGVAHASSVTVHTRSTDQSGVPAKAVTPKRRGFKATPLAPLGKPTRTGARLYADNVPHPGDNGPAGNMIASGTSAPNSLAPIVVTGIRGSLLRSLQIKRQSIGVVDAISAESIGQFPDGSIGGALAHLPGVTVDRGSVEYINGESGSTSTGQVQGVSVNGFGGSFNTILENGREIPVYNFSQMSAMYVGQIDVYKTPDLALSSGNIGSVINIKQLTPLENPGMHVRLNVGGNVFQMDGRTAPAVGALFSDTFDHNKFGILVDGDYTETHEFAHQMDIPGWVGIAAGSFPCANLAQNFTTAFGSTSCSTVGTGATGKVQVPMWYPQAMNMYLERIETRNKDGRVVLQWHPTSSLMVTLDENYSSWNQHINDNTMGTWFGLYAHSNPTLDGNGTVTNFTNTGATTFSAPMYNQEIVTNVAGVNVLWNPNADWTLELDADQAKAEFNPNGTYSIYNATVGYTGPNNSTRGLVLGQSGNVLPYLSAYGPGAVPSGSGQVVSANYLGLNPLILGSGTQSLATQQYSNQINEATLRATWTPGNTTKVTFGTQFIDDDYNNKYYDNQQANNYDALWAGYGPVNGSTQGVNLPASLFSSVNVGTWFPGFTGNSNLPAQMLQYNPWSLLSYLETQPIDSNWKPTLGAPRYTGGVPAEALANYSVAHVSRMNYAPFVQASHNFRVYGMKLMTRLGMRYQLTDEEIAGLPVPLAGVSWGGPAAPANYIFNYGPATWTTYTNSYGYFLPALDLALWPTHDLEIAFDASRNEASPPNSEMIPVTGSYAGSVGNVTATGSNPYLMPYLSNDYDLRVTWFYKHGDYAEIHPFYRQVTNFPTGVLSDITIPFNDPAPCSYSQNGKVIYTNSNCGKPLQVVEKTFQNALSADVAGATVTWQQLLPYGFGVLLNGTWMHSNQNFNPYNDSTVGQFVLPGVSSSVDGTLFYQKGRWQARTTVTWNPRQLLFLGQQENTGAFKNEPVYTAPFTQVDFSANYQIDKHIDVYFTAHNLLNAFYHTTGRFSNQTLVLEEYGRAFSFGVRASF